MGAEMTDVSTLRIANGTTAIGVRLLVRVWQSYSQMQAVAGHESGNMDCAGPKEGR